MVYTVIIHDETLYGYTIRAYTDDTRTRYRCTASRYYDGEYDTIVDLETEQGNGKWVDIQVARLRGIITELKRK